MTTPLDQEGQDYPVHCCVCLKETGTKTKATHTMQVGGGAYMLCDDHSGVSLAQLQDVWRQPGVL